MAVKIFLATVGSRGDNEPFKALALEAAAAGHEVFFAHTNDIPSQPQAPYTDVALPGSMGEVIARQGVSVFKALKNYSSVMKPMMERILEETTQQILALKPDVVVYHPKVLTAATAAHAVGGIAIRAEMVPMLNPTDEFAPVGMPAWIPVSWNKASYRIIDASLSAFDGQAKKLARRLGVISTQPDLTFVPVSPSIISPPKDWPDDVVMTGSWNTPGHGQLDEELAQFLEFGEVLYAGFGSMRDSRGVARADAIVQAARSLGMKTLMVTGWGGLVPGPTDHLAPDILVRESVPHTEVLPHCKVAIHHGGAGTLHAMLRAGVPSVIMPFLADQPWWARHLHQQKLGPEGLSRTTRTPSVIAASLAAALSYEGVTKLAGLKMATEDGLARAVSVIEEAEAGTHPLRPT